MVIYKVFDTDYTFIKDTLYNDQKIALEIKLDRNKIIVFETYCNSDKSQFLTKEELSFNRSIRKEKNIFLLKIDEYFIVDEIIVNMLKDHSIIQSNFKLDDEINDNHFMRGIYNTKVLMRIVPLFSMYLIPSWVSFQKLMIKRLLALYLIYCHQRFISPAFPPVIHKLAFHLFLNHDLKFSLNFKTL